MGSLFVCAPGTACCACEGAGTGCLTGGAMGCAAECCGSADVHLACPGNPIRTGLAYGTGSGFLIGIIAANQFYDGKDGTSDNVAYFPEQIT